MSYKNYNNLLWLLKNKNFQLLSTGLIQVTLVSLNTYQISHQHYIGAMIIGFFISLVWTFNVKRIAFGNIKDRLLYALGASLGTGLGIFIGLELYKRI